MKHIYDNQDNGNHINKPSEERFTERFKEVAKNYEPTFEPADWSAMQSKLAIHNEKDRKKVIFRRLATFATMGAAAIILLFGGYQFLNNSADIISKQNKNQNIAFQENSIQNSTNQNSNDDKTITQKELNQEIKQGLENSIKNNTENNLNNSTQKFTKTNSNSSSNSNFELGNNTEKNQIVSSSLTTNSAEKTNLVNSFLSENVSKNAHNNSTIEEAQSKKILSALKLEKTTFDLFAHVEPKEIIVPKLEIDETLFASTQNKELIRKNPVVSAIGKWRIGAALMAMTNIYKSNDKQRVNYANGYGVMADYQIAKRFNVSTGAVYTQKRIDIEEPFSVPNSTISMNPNNDNTWIKKNKTQINWQLIDLPIHLRYNAIETERNKWFVSAGTSNYFFLKENYESDYTVSYQDIYDPRLSRTQEVVSQRETQSAIQLFATINVSVGLETSLGKHLTLQVEPYWRFPVRSLGSEGVFVQTGGLLTRINFAL